MGLEGAMMICAKKDGEFFCSETFVSQKDFKQVKEELQPGPIYGWQGSTMARMPFHNLIWITKAKCRNRETQAKCGRTDLNSTSSFPELAWR